MSLPADQPARDTCLDLTRHVLALAPAGSGKTGLLVRRMLKALVLVDEPEQVLAISFTNKAAAEIRQRITRLLQRAQEEDTPRDEHDAASLTDARAVLERDRLRDWRLREQPGRLRALTFDGLNQQLAAQLPLLAGLGAPAQISEDEQGLYEAAVLDLFGNLDDPRLQAADRVVLGSILRLVHNRVDLLIPPLCALLERRETWLAIGETDWDAHEVQVLDRLIRGQLRQFTEALDPDARATLIAAAREAALNKGGPVWAADLRQWPAERADQLEVFRALANLLVTKGDRADKRKLRKKHDAKTGFLPGETCTKQINELLKSLDGDTRLAAVAAELADLPAAELPEDYRQLRAALVHGLRLLNQRLQASFARRGAVDYTAIALAAQAALGSEEAPGEALLAADRRIQHLLVDEMQDTSHSQLVLIAKLTSGWEPGDGRSLFLVGDPQQSIYAFRKAEVRLFHQMIETRALGALALTIAPLQVNFRSSGELVSWFNASFRQMFPARADFHAGAVPYAACTPRPGCAPDSASSVTIQALPEGSAQDEARALAEAAQQSLRLGGSVALLGRTRPQLVETLREFRRRGIPYVCTDMDPLGALPAVREVVALARALAHPEDRLHWAVLLRAAFVGLSWADLVALSRGRVREPWPARLAASDAIAELSEEGRARIARLQSALAALGEDERLLDRLAERTEALWHLLEGPACVSKAEHDEVIATLRLLRQHAPRGYIADAAAFERALQRLYASPASVDRTAVQVMTIHKSKGLEFDHVLLAGLHKGTRHEDAPLIHLQDLAEGQLLALRPPEAFDDAHPAQRFYAYLHTLQKRSRRHETLRLLYVACTRAARSLTLVAPAKMKGEEPRWAADSFAACLAPVLRSHFSSASSPTPLEKPVLAWAPPLSPRLPLVLVSQGWTLPTLFRPQEQRSLKPSEAVLHAREDKRAQSEESGVYARLVGSLLHEALEKIAQEGLDAWGDGGASRQQALAAGFRRLGLPEPQVEAAVARVMELLGRVLASDTGRRLLGPHRWAASEYALAGYRDGQWVSAVIDRCYESEDGTLWVVDYKTAAEPVPPELLPRYLEENTERYRPQVENYRALLGLEKPGCPIRAALYFVEADRLIELR